MRIVDDDDDGGGGGDDGGCVLDLLRPKGMDARALRFSQRRKKDKDKNKIRDGGT
jgi:hypothetical protein